MNKITIELTDFVDERFKIMSEITGIAKEDLIKWVCFQFAATIESENK